MIDFVLINYIGAMDVVWSLLIEYLLWPVVFLLVEIMLRKIPTLKDNSMVSLLLRLLDKKVPNNIKGGKVVKHSSYFQNKKSNNV